MRKLKPDIKHTFEIETDSMDELEFNFEIKQQEIVKKTKIIEVKRKSKHKRDGSTGLF